MCLQGDLPGLFATAWRTADTACPVIPTFSGCTWAADSVLILDMAFPLGAGSDWALHPPHHLLTVLFLLGWGVWNCRHLPELLIQVPKPH